MRTIAELQPEAELHWRRSDPILHRLSKAHPLPPEPIVPGADGFAELVRSIIHQQVSMAAARSMVAKTLKLTGGKFTPRRLLNRTPEQLREAGLSRTKAAYIHDLARKTLNGEVEFSRFPDMTDAAIIDELTAVKGIGPWTAKMFLLFHLHRPDVVAPEDLGLRMGVADAYGVEPTKAAKFMLEIAPKWAPYNSVAARVLWQSRRDGIK